MTNSNTRCFYSENPETFPVNETTAVWKVQLSYRKERQCVVAYINLVECTNRGSYVSETTELFGENSKAIRVCEMNRLNQKKLDSMQAAVNSELDSKMKFILDYTSDSKTIANMIADVVWQTIPN